MEEKEKTDNIPESEAMPPEDVQPEKGRKKKKHDEIVESLQKSLEEKEGQLKKAQEGLLYMQADFENFKKLKAKEREETLRYGNEALVKELLPVIDNLERALAHSAQTEETGGIREGVQLTLNQLLKVLEKSGVEGVEAMGKKFDPNLHEAFFQEERNDVDPDTVISEYQKGYLLNGRLLRPSVVVLAKRPEG